MNHITKVTIFSIACRMTVLAPDFFGGAVAREGHFTKPIVPGSRNDKSVKAKYFCPIDWNGGQLACHKLPSSSAQRRSHNCWTFCLNACTGADLSCVGQCLSICPVVVAP